MTTAATTLLIDRALGGNDSDRGALFAHLGPRLVLWAASRMSADLRTKVEPEDLAQEILLAVHRDFGQFRGTEPGQFLRWPFRLAENRIRDQVDHFAAEKRRIPDPEALSHSSPSSAVIRNETLGKVATAIESLDEDQRRAIQLVRFEERSAAEAGEELGRSANAVRILYCRALKALRQRMGDAGVLGEKS